MFPKILALTDPITETIVEFLLDCDAVGSSTEEVVEGVLHSLVTKLEIEEDFKFQGGCTDSVGSSTEHVLKRGFIAKGLATLMYHVGTCCLHNLQTLLEKPFRKFLAKEGWSKRQMTEEQWKKSVRRMQCNC